MAANPTVIEVTAGELAGELARRGISFVELAVSGSADMIVSGDADLLVLNPFRGIPIVSAATFAKGFGQGEQTLIVSG